MVLSHYSPAWFYGYDIILESSFAIIAMVVALFSFRMYQKTRSSSVKLFGIAFMLISISYIIQSILNFMIITSLNQEICRMVKLRSVVMFENIGLLIHIVFFTIGLALLLYTTLRTKNTRLLWLLIIISFGVSFLGSLYMFYFISTVYLAFISWHYIQNYLRKRQGNTLLIAFAFVFLLFGHFHYLIAVDHQTFYVIGHLLELFTYLLLAINLYLVQR